MALQEKTDNVFYESGLMLNSKQPMKNVEVCLVSAKNYVFYAPIGLFFVLNTIKTHQYFEGVTIEQGVIKIIDNSETIEELEKSMIALLAELKKLGAVKTEDSSYQTTNAEGYAYFDYPTLSYEEGLKNVQDALTNFEDGKSYTVDQIEAILKKLKVNEFTMGEFNKLKGVLKTNDVKIVATNGTGTSLGVYGEFKLVNNTVFINLATIGMDPKVETTQQVAQIIVHELIHSAVVYKTFRALNQDSYGDTENLTEIEQAAVKNLQYLFDEISKQPAMYEEYGLNNMDEMLAELSNPEFVEKLKKTKISNLRISETTKAKNLFELLIDAIVKLISGKDIKSPAYDLIYASYENLIANDSTVQQKAFEEAVKDNFANNDTSTVISQEDAFKYRKIEYPLTVKIRDEAGKLNRLTMANIRARRMSEPQDYDSYLANGKLNVQKVLERIQELEKELSSINAQIQAIEDDYADVSAKLTPYLQPGERDKLAALGYPTSEIRGMTSAEARIRINSGLTRDEYENGIQAETEEMEVKEQMEKVTAKSLELFTVNKYDFVGY